MDRKAQKATDVVRPRIGLPLAVVAGLSHGVAERVRNRLLQSEELPRFKMIAAPSPPKLSHLYSSGVIEALIRSTSEFAQKRQHNDGEQSPSRLFLFFTSAPGFHRLLDAFGFAPLPIDYFPEADRVLSIDEALARLFPLLLSYLRGNDETREIQRQVIDGCRKSLLLLPPRNFHLEGGDLVGSLLRKYRDREIPWSESPLEASKFTRADLPKAVHRQKDWFYRDSRKIVFPPDRVPHPPVREQDEDSTPHRLAAVLNQLFRFGFPIKDGFHFDAQRVGSPLRDETMHCAERGPVQVSGSHANVYPNDYIRDEK